MSEEQRPIIIKRSGKSLWWGPFPWEQDGGAIVHYYLLPMMNYIEPKHEFHCVPKVPDQLDAGEISFANFYPIRTRGLGDIPAEIPQLMMDKQIPVLTLFHIPWEFFPIVDSVHDIGGVVVNHQTIHWADDVLFQSDRLRNIDYWVAPTEYSKRLLTSKGRVSASKIKVFPHGVNLEKFYPHETTLRRSLGIKDDEKVITWVGRCQMTKGAHQIIPMIRSLLRDYPKVHFIARAGIHQVYKSHELGYMFRHMAKRHERLHFIPEWCEPSYMEDLMAMTDIGLCPSGHEGFSLPPLEWFACGVPVAVSALPVHVELLGGRNKHCGMLMETSEPAEIVNQYPSNPKGTMVKVPSSRLINDTLRYMLDNPDECEEMGINGLARARQHYDLAKISYQWLEFFDNITKDHNMDAEMQERLLVT